MILEIFLYLLLALRINCNNGPDLPVERLIIEYCGKNNEIIKTMTPEDNFSQSRIGAVHWPNIKFFGADLCE